MLPRVATERHSLGNVLRRQVTFRIGPEESSLLESAARMHGLLNSALCQAIAIKGVSIGKDRPATRKATLADPPSVSIQRTKSPDFQGFSSGAYRDRTGDLRLAKPALSQLS